MPLPSINSMPPAAMFATTLQPLLRQRADRGFVRRCHGDLHLANIALVDGRPLLFDAIEFDPVIATTDVLYDLAFTLMDLIHFNQASAANAVFNRYLAGAGDEGLDGLRLLPLFQSVRAAIRAHVLFMKSEQAGGSDAVWQEAKRYFDLAGRLITPRPPLLVAIGGLSGTGKSVLARGLAGLIEPPPGAVIIRSDVVRKHLFGAGETTALPESAYRPDVTERVYGMLSSTAQRVLAQGCSVVLDAAYLQEAERTEIAHLATTYGLRFVGLFLTADLATRLARIERRKGDASDATRNVALKQETFAIGAVNWHYDRCLGTPDQSLAAPVLPCLRCRTSADDEKVHPTGTSGRRKAAERQVSIVQPHSRRWRSAASPASRPITRAPAPAMPRPCIRSGSRSRGCAPPWRSLRRSWSMRSGCA